MILGNISTFAGHLHPLIVHLPIGFIVLAALLDVLSYKKKYENLKPAVPVILLTGFITAVLACILGYVLSLSGDYDKAVLSHHKLSGIVLAFVTGILYVTTTTWFKKDKPLPGKLFTVLLLGLVGLLSYSGHQGAGLTHGSNYLTLRTLTQSVRGKPADMQSAMLFEDVVQPILQNKCAQCHGDGKMKGNLSVDDLAALLKGGKHGAAVKPGNPGESELYKRVTLNPADKNYMPADGKPPLSPAEIKIIKWWIGDGRAGAGKTMPQLKNADSIKADVAAWLGFKAAETGKPDALAGPLNPDIPLTADTLAIKRLRAKGLMVRMMLKKPVMLDITLPAKSGVKMAAIKDDLNALAKNMVWLNLSGNGLTDADLTVLKAFINLEKLRLENNPLTDAVIGNLTGLKHLEAVNLNETRITAVGVSNLKKNGGVMRVYSWDSAVK